MQVESEWTGDLFAHERADAATISATHDLACDPAIRECVIRRRSDLDERNLFGGEASHEHRVDDLLEGEGSLDSRHARDVSECVTDRHMTLATGGELRPQRIDAHVQVDETPLDAHHHRNGADAFGPRRDDTDGVGNPLRAVPLHSTPQVDDLSTVHRRSERRTVLFARVVLVEDLGDWLEAGRDEPFAAHAIERAMDGVAVIKRRV